MCGTTSKDDPPDSRQKTSPSCSRIILLMCSPASFAGVSVISTLVIFELFCVPQFLLPVSGCYKRQSYTALHSTNASLSQVLSRRQIQHWINVSFCCCYWSRSWATACYSLDFVEFSYIYSGFSIYREVKVWTG